jgi:SpoVK/Ycf46/Vps4 family AAA+-type ATPase
LVSNKLLVEDKITLDDILNMWDGIRETPGRILIMTSNHYHDLDPALIRPGRIDISHEMKNASHKTIRDLYEHLFNDKIDEASLSLINEYFYSPAELINIYIYHNDATRFVERLMLNQKV